MPHFINIINILNAHTSKGFLFCDCYKMLQTKKFTGFMEVDNFNANSYNPHAYTWITCGAVDHWSKFHSDIVSKTWQWYVRAHLCVSYAWIQNTEQIHTLNFKQLLRIIWYLMFDVIIRYLHRLRNSFTLQRLIK